MDDEASLGPALDVAAYEALMVRWSMGTPEAQRAWTGMRQTDPPSRPRDALEHALWAFHVQDSLAHWLAKTRAGDLREGTTTGGSHGQELGAALAEDTGQDVVVVDTTAPAVCGGGVTVVRVVAPGARRLPADERAAEEGPLPHPFG